MGLFDWAKKIGRAVGGVAKKVGSFVQQGARRVGDIGGKVIDVAKKIQPYVKDIPIVGKAVEAVTKAGDIVDIAKKVGEGRFGEALEKGVGYIAPRVPVVGELYGRGKQLYEGGRGMGLF